MAALIGGQPRPDTSTSTLRVAELASPIAGQLFDHGVHLHRLPCRVILRGFTCSRGCLTILLNRLFVDQATGGVASGAAGVPTKLKLYSYWRSSCSFRVRIALNLKGLASRLCS